MFDRSGSIGGGDIDKLPAHLRDALKQAAAASSNDGLDGLRPPPTGRSSEDKAETERLREKCQTLEKRQFSLEASLKEKERHVTELRGYVHDCLRLHEREHAYLRATHLDPAIGLEIQLLKEQLKRQGAGGEQSQQQSELERQNAMLLAKNDELAAAAAAAESERNHLRLRLKELREELDVAREWNDQLEEEREELYGMLDDSKELPAPPQHQQQQRQLEDDDRRRMPLDGYRDSGGSGMMPGGVGFANNGYPRMPYGSPQQQQQQQYAVGGSYNHPAHQQHYPAPPSDRDVGDYSQQQQDWRGGGEKQFNDRYQQRDRRDHHQPR